MHPQHIVNRLEEMSNDIQAFIDDKNVVFEVFHKEGDKTWSTLENREFALEIGLGSIQQKITSLAEDIEFGYHDQSKTKRKRNKPY